MYRTLSAEAPFFNNHDFFQRSLYINPFYIYECEAFGFSIKSNTVRTAIIIMESNFVHIYIHLLWITFCFILFIVVYSTLCYQLGQVIDKKWLMWIEIIKCNLMKCNKKELNWTELNLILDWIGLDWIWFCLVWFDLFWFDTAWLCESLCGDRAIFHCRSFTLDLKSVKLD